MQCIFDLYLQLIANANFCLSLFFSNLFVYRTKKAGKFCQPSRRDDISSSAVDASGRRALIFFEDTDKRIDIFEPGLMRGLRDRNVPFQNTLLRIFDAQAADVIQKADPCLLFEQVGKIRYAHAQVFRGPGYIEIQVSVMLIHTLHDALHRLFPRCARRSVKALTGGG